MKVQEATKGVERQLAIRTWVLGITSLVLTIVGLVRLSLLP